MASSKRAIEQYIARARKQGKSDNVILVDLTKQGGEIGKGINLFIESARSAGASPSKALAEYFNLNIKAVNVNAAHNRNISKTRSRAESAAYGLGNAYHGILEGAASAGDTINKGINSVLGTNLETNAAGQVRKDWSNAKKDLDKGRAGSGRGTGTDWVQGSTELAATLPAFAIGGGAGVGLKGGAAFAGRQALIGAGVGAARHADNADERKANIGWGAAGAAVGGTIGEKIAAPAIKGLAQRVARRAANKTGNTARSAAQLVDDAIKQSDIPVDAATKRALIDEATTALSRGREIDATAAIRKKLLERHNIQGTQAQITRDPMTWTTEREAAKHSSKLNDVHVNNHQQLDDLMRQLIDDTGASADDTYGKMQSTFNALKQGDDAVKQGVNDLYAEARTMGGNNVALNHLRFINQASRELEEQGLGSFLKGDIRSIFKGMFDNPEFTLTYGKAEEIIKVLNARMRTTTDGNQRYALSIVRKNLEKEIGETADGLSTQLPNASGDTLLGTKQTWDDARAAYRQRATDIEDTPALKAALDEVEPDKAFDKYIKNGNAGDIARLVNKLKDAPNGQQSIADLQGATVEHLLSRATNSNGAFSPAGLNRAIKSLGMRRMQALFSPEQISRLNDIKRVSDILLQQPVGAHVNHSNTSSALIRQMLGLVNMAGKMPVIGNVAVGSVDMLGNMAKSGAAARMIDGQVPVAKSSLGLTDEQLRMLGLIPQRTGQAGAALGANAGD